MTEITPEEVTNQARLEHSWDVAGMPALTQKQSGRRVTIDPARVTVSANRTWREGLHVLIEGRVIRQNGTPGLVRRGVVFVDTVRWADDYPMQALPSEYLPYLEAARRVEAAR